MVSELGFSSTCSVSISANNFIFGMNHHFDYIAHKILVTLAAVVPFTI